MFLSRQTRARAPGMNWQGGSVWNVAVVAAERIAYLSQAGAGPASPQRVLRNLSSPESRQFGHRHMLPTARRAHLMAPSSDRTFTDGPRKRIARR